MLLFLKVNGKYELDVEDGGVSLMEWLLIDELNEEVQLNECCGGVDWLEVGV